MTIKQELVGYNEDGSAHYAVSSDNDMPIMLTGQVAGSVTVPSGNTYDVTPQFIEVNPDDLAHVSDAIGDIHVELGHPEFVKDPTLDNFGFVATKSDGTIVANAKIGAEALQAAADALGVTTDAIQKVEV